MSCIQFQSTLSVRRATEYIKNDVLVLKISIHALREESDGTIIMDSPNLQNISIHALREESDAGILSRTSATIKFQSTLSVRRATQLRRQVSMTVAISIHALREESDPI